MGGLKKRLATLTPRERKEFIEPASDLSLVCQTRLLGISRASWYTHSVVSPKDIRIQHAIDEIFTKHPFLGSRRIRDDLKNQDINICRDQVRRHIRAMGIETVYPRKRINLSAPNVRHRVYPYLLTNLPIIRPNQVWGTDITYIRLRNGFCYLVVLLDWYSRYVIAWELSPSLEIDFCIENLTHALTLSVPETHNSDQGSHFTSPRYTDLLTERDVQISMDGRGRCMDNIFTERFWRTLKYEDVYLKGYETLQEARAGIDEYIRWYNCERKHGSLGNYTPEKVYRGIVKNVTPITIKKDLSILSTLSTLAV